MVSYIVVNLRGRINATERVKRTLRMLNIPKKHMATIVPNSASYIGMLNKVRQRVAWCEANIEMVKMLLEKRGRKLGDKRLTEEDVKALGFNSFEDFAKALVEDKVRLKDFEQLKPFFRLSPPRKGFLRSTRREHPQGGVLGYNPELPKLIERMV
jgi:large subunit ribosomal protein L30